MAACVLCEAMPALILPLIEAVAHWPATRRAGRPRSRHQDHRRRRLRSRPPARDRRRDHPAQGLQGRRGAAACDAGRAQGGRLRAGPAHQHGRQRRARARNRPAPLRAISRRLTDLAIALWDERLSTVAVERELIGMDMSRARRAEVIDEHAAIFILQGALDRLATLRNCAEIADDGGRDCGAAAGVHPDRARLRPEAHLDAAGDAMARAGAADLLRAVPGAVDPDAGQGRPHQGADRRRRRRAVARRR